MYDLADTMNDLTANPTFTNWLYDGIDQDFLLTPLTYTQSVVSTFLAQVIFM